MLKDTQTKKLVVKKANNGDGVFALAYFKPEDLVYTVTGVFMSGDEDEEMDEETRSNQYRFDEDVFISPKGTLGDFFNHSCKPNAKIVKSGDVLQIVAYTPIKKGDEIVFDYSTVIASDDSWTMHCNCGSKVCRGLIGQFKKIPKTLQQRYKKDGVVPGFIQSI